MSLRQWADFDFLCWRLPGSPRRFVVLVRHFFIRFFQNDVFPFEEQMKEKLYVVLAMIAPLGWVLTSSLFSRYIFVADSGQSWLEKCQLLSFFMVLMVFIAILEWDVLFIDRRDYLNLTGLPIRPATIFRAKFISLLFFVALYAASVCSLSNIATGFFLPQWIGNSAGTLFLYMAAQTAAMTLSFYFAFFLVLSLEAVLLGILGTRLFRTASLAVRFILAAGCFAFLIIYLVDHRALYGLFQRLAEMRETRPSLFLLFPPVWFTSIYEKIIGRHGWVYDIGAMRGLLATAGLGLFSFLALAWSYRRHMRKSLEIRSPRRPFRAAAERLQTIFDRLFLRRPVERAIFHFFGRTLRNSPRLKVRLAGLLAVALGFLFVLVRGTAALSLAASAAGLNVLAIPAVLTLALLLAFRTGVNIPLAAEANWIFRLTEEPPRRSYFIALKKAVFFFGLLPLFLALFGVYAFIWGPGPAALHALYGLACALLYLEVLFLRYDKIPFSCLVVPGKAQLHNLVLPYALGFLLVVTIQAAGERWLLRNPPGFWIFFGATSAALLGLSLYQRYFVYEKLTIVYEEEPEPVMVTLS